MTATLWWPEEGWGARGKHWWRHSESERGLVRGIGRWLCDVGVDRSGIESVEVGVSAASGAVRWGTGEIVGLGSPSRLKSPRTGACAPSPRGLGCDDSVVPAHVRKAYGAHEMVVAKARRPAAVLEAMLGEGMVRCRRRRRGWRGQLHLESHWVVHVAEFEHHLATMGGHPLVGQPHSAAGGSGIANALGLALAL